MFNTIPSSTSSKTIPNNVVDAAIVASLTTGPNELPIFSGHPEIGSYIRRSIEVRMPLVVTSHQQAAQAFREIGCLAYHVRDFELMETLPPEITLCCRHFNGTYLILKENEIFRWEAYKLAANHTWDRSGGAW